MKNYKLLIHLGILVIILILLRIFLFKYFDFNSALSFINESYATYGWLILLVSGFIEALIIVGLYYPGSTIILLGASLAGAKIIGLPTVILWSTAGIVLALICNYYIGRKYGDKILLKITDKEKIGKIRKQIEDSKLIYIWSTIHPNLVAIVSVLMGAAKVNFKKFFSLILICQLFWSTFWGVIFFLFGLALLNKITAISAVVLTIAFVFEIYKIFFKHKVSQSS